MAQTKETLGELPELGNMPVIKKPEKKPVSRKRRMFMFLSKYTLAILLGVLSAISIPAISEGVEEGLKPPPFIQTLVDEVNPIPEPTASQRIAAGVTSALAEAQRRYYALTEGWFDPSEREVKLRREIEILHKDVKFLTDKAAKQDREIRVKQLERGVKHEEMTSCAEEAFMYLKEIGSS